jgi:hypothetical protein
MREKLNSNPLAQLAVVGVLLVLAGVFVMSSMGGGSKGGGTEAEAGGSATAAAPAPPASEGDLAKLPAPGSGVGAPPPTPRSVTAAFASNDTVVLLFVGDGGIDDRMVAADVRRLSSFPQVAAFVVPAHRIAHYAGIAQGVDLNRVPALVVLRPKHLDRRTAVASVHYGYQSPQSVEQAIIDAGYKGRTVPYHP